MFKKLILLLLSLLFILPISAHAQINKPLTIILDWFPNPDHAPLFIAQEQGFFQKQGITVNIISPPNPDDGPKLVAAGQADLAVTYQPQLMLQIDQGLPLTRIATLINQSLNCLMIKADNSIKNISDLKNKKIGYSSNVIDKAMLDVMLKNAGLSLNQVDLINVQYGGAQALLAGKIDALAGVMRNYGAIEMQLLNQRVRLFYAEKNGFPFYDELIIVTHHQLLNDPRLIKFNTALTEAIHFLKKYPEQSWQVFAKHHPELNNSLNHQVWLATVPYFTESPAKFNKLNYQKLAEFMQQQYLIKSIPPLETYSVVIK